MRELEPRPTLTVEILPPFPRPFVRWPVYVRPAPDRGFWLCGIGRLRVEWSRTGTR